jgi:lysophospholipase L1-like esterase
MRRVSTIGLYGCALALAACGPAASPQADVQSALTLGSGAYNFGALASPGKCLDISGGGFADGTQLQEWDCNGTGAQAFSPRVRSDGQTELVNTRTGKCVDINGLGTADGTKAQLWTCNGSGAQAFRLDDAGNGNVHLVNTHSNKCVDVSGSGTADGTKVQLWTCNNTNAQNWRPATTPYRIKVMPLGASITWGYGGTHAGYRNPLGNLFNQHSIAHVFVGSSTENPGQLSVDEQHHEGHPGYVIAAGSSGRAGIQDNIATWLGPSGADPDYILLLVGSNDVDTDYQLDQAGTRMDTLITTISNRTTGLKPQAHLIVSTLPLINTPAEEVKAQAFNAAIMAVAKKHQAAGENVSTVDVHAVITAADKYDNLHPNDAGYDKIANVWYAAFAQ